MKGKRFKFTVLLVMTLAMLVWCVGATNVGVLATPASAQGIDTTGWITIFDGSLRVPPTWSYEICDFSPDTWVAGENDTIRMSPFGMNIDDLFADIDIISYQEFIFDDARRGYMLERPDSIIWANEIEEGFVVTVSLYHGGNRSVFTDNEDLILRVARTLTTWE